MKLMRLGKRGLEKPAVWASENSAIDVSSIVTDFDPSFFADGGIEKISAAIAKGGLPNIQLESVRIGAPVTRPGKLMAVGKNYAEHAKETNSAVPEKPIFFVKATSAINGPFDDVVLPANYTTVDYEVELALVIGRRAKRVDRTAALAHVAGYLICNDVTERTAQAKEGSQWFRGKSFDTFAPLGPFLVTPDEVGNPHALSLVCRVDGEVRQNGHTKDFIFDIPYLIEFISRNVTLEPGDIITTGTPAGVGHGMNPPVYLKAGQEMELEVTGLGQQRTRLAAEKLL
jgi:2-keto-4-pentenoate hydratase/2-oxohepta-3-ene-1,7-dioic acid hydratase in catechol pathway